VMGFFFLGVGAQDGDGAAGGCGSFGL